MVVSRFAGALGVDTPRYIRGWEIVNDPRLTIVGIGAIRMQLLGRLLPIHHGMKIRALLPSPAGFQLSLQRRK